MDWSEYRNDEHGFSLSYPAALFDLDRSRQKESAVAFVSEDGDAELLVGAFANDQDHTPASYQRYIAEKSYPGADIDYAPRGQSWFVISGERDGAMHYEKVMFSCDGGVINSFAMVYPVGERELYDPIVERIEDSFQPGEECG